MNNKLIGTAFERRVCRMLSHMGYWVHFLVPDARGAQPFDIIAVKNGKAIAVECKTLTNSKKSFSLDRLEDNQKYAFDLWMMLGNSDPIVAVEYYGKIYGILYSTLKQKKTIKMEGVKECGVLLQDLELDV